MKAARPEASSTRPAEVLLQQRGFFSDPAMNPFTADKLKWAKIIDFSLSLYGPQHFWTEFRIYQGIQTRIQTREHSDVVNEVLNRNQSLEKFIYSQRWTKTLCWLFKDYFDDDFYSYVVEKMEE
ncbi:hypothetical protein PO909_008489 [Leuciscus waleckii]